MPTLIEVRQRRGLSQGALAYHARVSVSTVYRIEQGKTAPRPHVMQRLCLALGVRPEEIVEFVPFLRRTRLDRANRSRMPREATPSVIRDNPAAVLPGGGESGLDS